MPDAAQLTLLLQQAHASDSAAAHQAYAVLYPALSCWLPRSMPERLLVGWLAQRRWWPATVWAVDQLQGVFRRVALKLPHAGIAAPVTFDTVTRWHDDANNFGSVGTPLSFTITVGAQSQSFNIIDPATDLPFASALTLGAGFAGNTLELQVFRRASGVLLSELAFTAAASEPGSWALMAGGLLGVALRRLRLQRKQAL